MSGIISNGCWALVLGLFVAVQPIGPPAFAEMTVERGDVLYVSVIGTPEMTRDAKVDADGRIRLPLIGGVDVAGAGIDEIGKRIEAVLVERNIVLDPVVLVEVATYRPIYVGGAVKKSGAIPFEPGLTVHHALIVAGGLQTDVSEDSVGIGQVLELLARQRAAVVSLAQTDSEIFRLTALLAQTDEAAIAKFDAGSIVALDHDLLNDLNRQRIADDNYAQTALKLVGVELDVLNQQAAYQKQEQDIQREEVERTRDLVDRGLVPLPQLKELQREGSRLSRDLLENYAFAARARQSMEAIRHSTSANTTEKRVQTREAHRAALQKQAALQSDLDIISGHLLAVGQQGGEADMPVAIRPEIVIFRQAGGAVTELPATMETDLEPGDIVELRLPALQRGQSVAQDN